MESFVEHPDAEQLRSSVAVGEAGGIFPGRLPFIFAAPASSFCALLLEYSREAAGRLSRHGEEMWRKGYGMIRGTVSRRGLGWLRAGSSP
jgi:hypothetical protein